MDASVYQRLHPHTYLERFLENGVRIDGRKETEWRDVGVNVGSITTAEGSSLVRLGETTVVCGVKVEVAEPELDRPNDGWIVPNLDLPPLCSPKFKPGPPADEAQILSDRLFQILTKVIDTKTLCIEPAKAAWVLYIDVTCINYDGNVFDASLLGIIAALKNARLPQATYDAESQTTTFTSHSPGIPLKLSSYPLSFSYGTFEKSLLSDPSSFEEPLLGSTIWVLVDEKLDVVEVRQEGFSALAQPEPEGPGGFDGGGRGMFDASTKLLERCVEGAKKRRGVLKKQLGF